MRRGKSGRPFLVESQSDMVSRPDVYKTGAIAPETGIYRVVHVAHRLPHEVVILKNDRFPRCSKCSDAVLFRLVHAAPDLFRSPQIRSYELPVIEEEPTAESA